MSALSFLWYLTMIPVKIPTFLLSHFRPTKTVAKWWVEKTCETWSRKATTDKIGIIATTSWTTLPTGIATYVATGNVLASILAGAVFAYGAPIALLVFHIVPDHLIYSR